MATTRLTTNIREALLKQLLTRAFKDRAQDLVNRVSAFTIRVYEDAMGADLAAIKALPSGWLPEGDDMKVMMAGDMKQLSFGGGLKYNIPSEFRECGAKMVEGTAGNGRLHLRFPNNRKGNCLKQYDAAHPLSLEFTALENEQQDLVQEIDRAQRSAKAAMESVTTVSKLIEVWPEVEEFARPYLVEGERRAVLPTIPREQLNKALCLPPEERVAA